MNTGQSLVEKTHQVTLRCIQNKADEGSAVKRERERGKIKPSNCDTRTVKPLEKNYGNDYRKGNFQKRQGAPGSFTKWGRGKTQGCISQPEPWEGCTLSGSTSILGYLVTCVNRTSEILLSSWRHTTLLFAPRNSCHPMHLIKKLLF